jgi:hypothetical protein
MAKRKREDTSVEAVFLRHRTELFHALKSAKGFERQRQSKRLGDPKTAPDRKSRIQNEIVVLKSLDLEQTAHAHLCSSLLRFKAVAEAEKLPNEIKAGVPKPELTEEERAALHNVTSSLYNRVEVKAVVDKAVGAVCTALGVPVPEKRGRVRKDKREEKGAENAAEAGKEKKKGKDKVGQADKVVDAEEDRGAGKKKKKEKVDEIGQGKDAEMDDDEEEKAISQLDKFLGLESDDENDSDNEEILIKGRRKPTASKELDPMEITDEEDGDDEKEDDDDLDPMEVTDDEEEEASGSGNEFSGFSDSDDEGQQSSASDDEDASDAESSASSISRPPPAKKVATAKKAVKSLKPTDSTFLPTLMGGYISGSESASDIDIAPERKNRRGQRARQAIWEKKFKEKAKHLQEGAKKRDTGWDLKRGAVGDDSRPWKRGIRNPLLDNSKGTGANEAQPGPPMKEKAPRVRDDTGPLHPSWEAKRLLKEKLQSAPYQGKRITFD